MLHTKKKSKKENVARKFTFLVQIKERKNKNKREMIIIISH